MSPKQQLESFAQSIYLVIKNRYFDEIEGEDGQVYVSQVIDWTNMFLDELRFEVDTGSGDLVDWWFARENGSALGTAAVNTASIALPTDIDRLITDETRYVQVLQGDAVISNWKVVAPKNITNDAYRVLEDMCAVVGTTLVFSRNFRDTEDGGTIVGDVMTTIPNVSLTNVRALSIVKPGLLLKLGVAKNATLPDIVQGGLNPAYVQKFNDLLGGAMARSRATSVASYAQRDNYGYIRGNY